MPTHIFNKISTRVYIPFEVIWIFFPWLNIYCKSFIYRFVSQSYWSKFLSTQTKKQKKNCLDILRWQRSWRHWPISSANGCFIVCLKLQYRYNDTDAYSCVCDFTYFLNDIFPYLASNFTVFFLESMRNGLLLLH